MIRVLDGQGPPAERSEVGGKAASIDRLAREGLSVPPALCLTAEADWPDDEDGLAAGMRDALAEGVDALGERCDPGTLLAVRSSALAEDSPEHSFAGQHDTILGVRPEEVADAVLRCRRSLRSQRSRSYRARVDAAQEPERMGVVVQALVPAEVSAVAFTADPISGGDAELVINASFGLGAPIVSGEADADTIRLDRASLAVNRLDVGEKRQRLLLDPGAGVVATTVGADPRAALTPFRAAALGRLALAVEEIFGTAVDIEAACVGRRWWLLQARPVTSLGDRAAGGQAIPDGGLVEATR